MGEFIVYMCTIVLKLNYVRYSELCRLGLTAGSLSHTKRWPCVS